VKRRQEVERLRQIIAVEPGLTQNQVISKAGLMKAKGSKLLKDHTGRLWKAEDGPRNSVLYFPLVLETPEPVRTAGTGEGDATGSAVLSPIGENRKEPCRQIRTTGSVEEKPIGVHKCRIHGEHSDFYRGGQVCALCHPMPDEERSGAVQ